MRRGAKAPAARSSKNPETRTRNNTRRSPWTIDCAPKTSRSNATRAREKRRRERGRFQGFQVQAKSGRRREPRGPRNSARPPRSDRLSNSREFKNFVLIKRFEVTDLWEHLLTREGRKKRNPGDGNRTRDL
jgi:hypothetical protein